MGNTAILNNKKIFSWDINQNNEPERKQCFKCDFCQERLVFVRDLMGKRIQHFRHYKKSDCLSENESKEHMLMKKILWEKFELNKNKSAEMEKKFKNNIADIYFKYDYKDIIFECQHSHIMTYI
jgi:competence CoiA-like predicted nuclease